MEPQNNQVENIPQNGSVLNKQLGGETGKNLRKNNMVRRVGLGLALLIFAGAFLAIGAAVGAELLEDESKDLVEEPIISDETELQEETEEEEDAIDDVVEEIVNDGCFDEVYRSSLSGKIVFFYDNCKFTVQTDVVIGDQTLGLETEIVTVSNQEDSSTLTIQFMERPTIDGGGPPTCFNSEYTQIDSLIARLPGEAAEDLFYIRPTDYSADYSYIPGVFDPRNINLGDDGTVLVNLPELGIQEQTLDTVLANANVCKDVRLWYSQSGFKTYEDIGYEFNSGSTILLIMADIESDAEISEEELLEFDEIIKSLTY